MIERVIENWLININERAYQVPFSQLLSLKGYKVLHLSSHGAGEHGKDIITFDETGTPCAFQLKTGNVGTSEWRNIAGEINELIDLAIVHPSIDTAIKHRAVLVTNGKLSDDVRAKIVALNESNARRNVPFLEVIAGKELLSDFIKFQGEFLPTDPKSIHGFLGLYIYDGKRNLPETDFVDFVVDLLFISGDTPLNAKRRIAATVLLTKYALNQFEKESNFAAVIKAWTILAAYIMAKSERDGLKTEFWQESFELCWYEISRLSQEFKEEILSRKDYLEGDIIGDGGPVYKTRTTLLMGWLAANELAQRTKDPTYPFDTRVIETIKKNWSDKLFEYWGESASSCLFLTGHLMRINNEVPTATGMFSFVLGSLAEANSQKSKIEGLPDPYYSAEECLLIYFKVNEEEVDLKNFIGTSYTLRAFINSLVNLDRRDIIEKHWNDLSRIHYCSFMPDPKWDFYLWRAEGGEERQDSYEMQGSWEKLKELARFDSTATVVPGTLASHKYFLPIFLWAYPHRLTPGAANLCVN